MKNRRIRLIAVALALIAVIAVADDAKPKVTGSFTNTTHSVTNTKGKAWLQSVAVWGTFTTTSNVNITLNNAVGSTTNAFQLFSSVTTTNTAIAFPRGAIPWENLGVISFLVGSDGVTVNEYAIESTVTPK